jgi:ribosomal protein S18 acetylase RimI-like enzyme
MIELVMVLDDLSQLPRFPLPSGYSFRGFREGEGELWARIETSAGEFASVEQAIEHFRKEFGGFQRELGKRCLFVQTEGGEPVGTAMAWYGTLLPGGMAGRLHWVGIRKEYQGRGIGKPLVSRAMELLSARHDRTYLTTQRSSLAAIKIYLDFGFLPYITERVQEKEWSEISKQLGFANLDIVYSS